MGKKHTRRLTRKQLAVIDDLFAGDIDEQQVLSKHNLSQYLYRKWLGDELFAAELDIRLNSARKQGELIIARSAPEAAQELIKLTKNKSKPETARKACVDLIGLLTKGDKPGQNAPDTHIGQKTTKPMTPQVAAKLLAVLAEENMEGGVR